MKRKRSQDDKKTSATVRELLRQKRTDLDISIPQELLSPEHVDKNIEEIKKPLSSVTLASINDTIESVVKATVEVANNHENKSNMESLRNKGYCYVKKIIQFLFLFFFFCSCIVVIRR